jgi:uncharacterized protein (TIGR02099 family)
MAIEQGLLYRYTSLLNKRAFRRVWLIVAAAIIAVASLQGILHLAGGTVGKYRAHIEQLASHIFANPVSMEDIAIGWHWFSPVIRIQEVTVFDNDSSQKLLQVDRLDIQINLLASLLRRQIEPGYIVIAGARLRARHTEDGSVLLSGFAVHEASIAEGQMGSFDIGEIEHWLMSQSAIVLRDVTVVYQDQHGEELVIDDLNLVFQQHLNHHYTFTGQLSLVQEVPTKVSFVMQLHNNQPAAPKWQGDLYVQADDVVIKQWFPLSLQHTYQVSHGAASFRLWGQIADSQLDNAQLEFQLAYLDVDYSDGQAQSFEQVTGELFYEQLAQGWSLTGNNIAWLRQEPIAFSYQRQDNWHQLQIPRIELMTLNPILSLYAPLAVWQTLQPTGDVSNVTAQWVTSAEDTLPTWQVSADFNAVSWQTTDTLPGVSGLSGRLQGSPDRVLMMLDSHSPVVHAPQWYSQLLRLSRLQAQVAWSRTTTGWELVIDKPLLSAPWIELQAERWRITQDDAAAWPDVDIHARLKRFATPALEQLLPEQVIYPALYDYLAHFALAGEISGDIYLQGNLQDYPFAQDQGQLLADLQLKDLELIYYKDWPVVSGLAGQVVFHNNQMIGRIDEGVIAGNSIAGIQVVLDDLGGRELLTIKGQVGLEPAAGMSFVHGSPLKDDLAMLDHLAVHDEVQLDLMTTIKFLGNEEIELVVDGLLTFADNQIDFSDWPIDLTGVKGQVNFDEKGITDSRLQAYLWDLPLALQLATQPTPTGYAVVADVTGELDVANLSLPSPWSSVIVGRTEYQAWFEFHANDAQPHQFHWRSDLQGIDIQLPAPFTKQATEIKPVELATRFTLGEPVDVAFKWDELLAGRMLLAPSDTEIDVPRGEIKFSAIQANMPEQDEWRVTGYLPELSISDWQTFINQHVAEVDSSSLTMTAALDLIDVTIGELTFNDYQWQDVNMQLRHAEPVWRIDLASEQIAGEAYFTEHYLNGLRVHLTRLHLPRLATDTMTQWSLAPRDIPPLDITVDDLYYADNSVGSFRLITEVDKDNNRLQVNKFDLRNQFAAVVFSGAWQEQAQGTTTDIKGYLTSTNFTQLMRILKPSSVLESRFAKIEFDLAWPNKPTEFVLAQTQGDIKFKFERGRLTGLDRSMEEKVGLGKMLNILSFQSFWRRLALDFNDLTQKGLGFNIVQGRANLSEGMLTTKDTYLNGSVVYIAVQGDLNLMDETYDITLRVVPYLTGSLPILAVLAVNPIVGAATFVADRLVSLGRRETGGTLYKVTGAWNEPQIAVN